MFDDSPIMMAVCAMFDPIIPAAPEMTSFSFVKNFIAISILVYIVVLDRKSNELLFCLEYKFGKLTLFSRLETKR